MLITHWNFSEWTWEHILGAVIFLVVGTLVIVIYNLIKYHNNFHSRENILLNHKVFPIVLGL